MRLLPQLSGPNRAISVLTGAPRFLQANKGSVEEAAAHFRRMLAWYREADIGKTCFDVEGKEWSADFVEGGRELLHMMCIDVCMQAADGTMLWVHRDGLIQFDEIMGLPDEDFILRMCLLCESMQIYLDHRSEETGRLVKMIQVRDLKGFNITEVLWNPAAMKRFVDAAAILETAYPETLAQMIIVNPPSGFNLLWMAMQPMLSQRMREKIKEKFLLISDGVFQFPQLLAVITGTAALKGLTDSGSNGVGLGTFSPGQSRFRYRVLPPGGQAQWSFQIGPGGSLQLQVIIFEFEDGRSSPVIHQVFPMQAVSGAVSGHCGPLGLSGLLWFTWYNDSWTSTMQVKDLKISVNSSGEDLRNPSCSTIPLQPLGLFRNRKERWKNCLMQILNCCCPPLFGKKTDVDELPMGDHRQMNRHAEVEKAEMVEMEVELRAEPEEPEEPEADLLILWREP
ncbi:unnamed protein product [Durusdinium trenchii]|uniref:CRAL-TRIO domain-containing protein n=1 Tax=Durusdinium trenchii TaxID=1381693 RepID=A0ABP0M5L4_9DINO